MYKFLLLFMLSFFQEILCDIYIRISSKPKAFSESLLYFERYIFTVLKHGA